MLGVIICTLLKLLSFTPLKGLFYQSHGIKQLECRRTKLMLIMVKSPLRERCLLFKLKGCNGLEYSMLTRLGLVGSKMDGLTGLKPDINETITAFIYII